MIEIKNQFARNILFWVFTLPLVYILVAPGFIQVATFQVQSDEMQMLKTLGRDTDDITRKANATFQRFFVDTGIFDTSKSLMGDPNTKHDALSKTAASNFGSIYSRYLNGLWMLVYRAIWRILGLWPVLSVLLLSMVLPSIIDGLAVRGRKLDQFKPHNPVIFWASAHSAISVAGIFVVLPLMPVSISLWMLYACVGLIALSLWNTAANLQTGN
jgi:hypothetical protein